MQDQAKALQDDTKSKMDHAYNHATELISKVRAGKATPGMLDVVMVEYYGNLTPLSQVANVTTPDARTLQIQPWEASLIGEIEKGITKANLGLNPQNDGKLVRITVPPLTEERRKDLVKQAKSEAEGGKIAIRNIRKDAMERSKALVKAGLPQDDGKKLDEVIQKLTDGNIAQLDKALEQKEKEILTV
jgi:ribosome recycling factor